MKIAIGGKIQACACVHTSRYSAWLERIPVRMYCIKTQMNMPMMPNLGLTSPSTTLYQLPARALS